MTPPLQERPICDGALVVANAPRSFDQVFVDQRMPGITGLETYQRIREINEDLPVCFMTGFSATTELENVVRIDDFAELLRKPFDRGDLVRVLAERGA